MSDTKAVPPVGQGTFVSGSANKKQNDIHGLDVAETSNIPVRTVRERHGNDRSYTIRDLIKSLADADDMDAIVCFRFRGCDPITVSDVEFEEGQVILEGEI